MLTFAVLPTVWRWATEAKIYPLNILLYSSVLYLLARLLPRQGTVSARDLLLPAFLLGLQIDVHSTTVLLIPGLVLLVWLNLRPALNRKGLAQVVLALVLPGLLYLYVPLRGEQLIAQYGRQEAIRRGLLADFYHSGLSGWVRYFTAADFTGGVVTNWGRLPADFVKVYLPLLVDNITLPLALIGLAGAVGLAVRRPRLFWPLFLLYAVPIPFVLTYGQGEQAAFLHPSFLIFSLFAGFTLLLAWRLAAAFLPVRPAAGLLFLLFAGFLLAYVQPQAAYSVNRLTHKWDRSHYEAWADALAHPLEPGAALLAHWGDLTTFWYMQYAEGLRPDLRGLYPPTEAVVQDYLQAGGTLYIAGPLQGWAAGIETRYRLIPWGRLVRIAPRSADPQSLLPPLSHPVDAVFSDRLRLLGADYRAQAVGGQDFGVALAWQTLVDLPPESTVSLRLTRGDDIVAQLDDALLSGWFPQETLPAGQFVLGYMPVPVPLGTLPGVYRLQVAVYTDAKQPWAMPDGAVVLDLGQVEVISPPADTPVKSERLWLPVTFGGEIDLLDYNYSVARVGQGKGFAVRLLWQARTQPAEDYTLLVELVDRQGRVLRTYEHVPADGLAPTSTWPAGQFVRDQVDVVLPASAPPGDDAVRVRLGWRKADGSRLAVRRWLWPAGRQVDLHALTVTEKEGRVFDLPVVQLPLETNLENKVRLLGYNSPQMVAPGNLQVSLSECAETPEGCLLHFELYWQGISEMDRLYYVFLHLVDAQGQIVAQHDRVPGRRGKQPTTGWLPGEVVLDPIDLRLPSDLPPGRYSLRVGMYLPPDGPRLLILDGTGQPAGDFVEMGAVEVR
ncbi:MAG: DUF2723 domain-containing protein [Chloroflexi bacterium]|nr:MAG: DUF2723 domain-containing protein [Chloroflexota bacterium]